MPVLNAANALALMVNCKTFDQLNFDAMMNQYESKMFHPDSVRTQIAGLANTYNTLTNMLKLNGDPVRVKLARELLSRACVLDPAHEYGSELLRLDEIVKGINDANDKMTRVTSIKDSNTTMLKHMMQYKLAKRWIDLYPGLAKYDVETM